MKRSRLGAAGAALAMASLVAAQPAAALGLPRTGGGFAVSGKGGPFIKQVASRQLDQAQRQGGAMGLAADAVNQGQFQASRLRMPQTEAKVKAFLDRIEAKWPYAKDQPTKVIILGVDHYNAYSLPDGSVVVAFGLLDQATSDDEVAFVLAHELGHLRLGHFASRAKRGDSAETTSRLAQMFVVGSAVRNGMSGGGFDADAAAAGRQAEATSDLLHFVNTSMIEPSHSREQEDEADAVGFDLAQMDDYAADTASARVFDTIQADESNRRALADSLNSQLSGQLGKAVRDGSALSLVSRGMAGGDVKMGLLKGAGRVALGVAGSAEGGGAQHRPPEERKKGIANYSADAYPEGLPLREEQQAFLKDVRSTREFADARIAVGAVKEAMKRRAAGDYAGAEKQIALAAATPFGKSPLVLNTAARIRDSMGDVARADLLFNQAHQSPDQTVDGYVDHVRMLYRAKRDEDAYKVIDAGTARFGDDDKPFVALLVAIARQDGDASASQSYLQRCVGYGDPNLTKDCQLAAGDSATAAAQPELKPAKPSLGGLGGLGAGMLRRPF